MQNERGVALVITFFIMVMIVASVLFASLFLYSRITLIRNVSDSVASFYLADSGIEKVFYYDRKMIPAGATRGVCQMCNSQSGSQNGSCPDSGDFLGCSCTSMVPGSVDPTQGCDPSVCDDCQMNFDTLYGNKQYSVKVTVFPPNDPNDLKIQSFGLFDNIGRAIEVLVDFINKTP